MEECSVLQMYQKLVQHVATDHLDPFYARNPEVGNVLSDIWKEVTQ